MNFLQLQTRVAQEAGIDLSVADDETAVQAWINQAYQHVSGLFNWPWLVQNTIFQTVADITTGTVSINAGDTTVTFTDAPASSVATDYMIQFTETSLDWYFVTSHTGGATTATISVPFVGSSNVTGAAYILRKVFYSLDSTVDRIVDMRQSITQDKIEWVDVRTFDRLVPDPEYTGPPIYYLTVGMDASNNWRVVLYPTPSTVLNIQLRYYQKITELSSDSDEPLVPAKWQNALVFGALAMYGHDFIDDSRVKSAMVRYGNVIGEMMKHYSQVPDARFVIQPWDTRVRRNIFPLRFPSNFPEYYGY